MAVLIAGDLRVSGLQGLLDGKLGPDHPVSVLASDTTVLVFHDELRAKLKTQEYDIVVYAAGLWSIVTKDCSTGKPIASFQHLDHETCRMIVFEQIKDSLTKLREEFPSTTFTVCTHYTIDVARFNQSASPYLRQTEIDLVIKYLKGYIVSFNITNSVPTARLHYLFHKNQQNRGKKNRKIGTRHFKCYYERLQDGCHPNGTYLVKKADMIRGTVQKILDGDLPTRESVDNEAVSATVQSQKMMPLIIQ